MAEPAQAGDLFVRELPVDDDGDREPRQPARSYEYLYALNPYNRNAEFPENAPAKEAENRIAAWGWA
jgi:hypothetical protein